MLDLVKVRSGSAPTIICIDGFLTKDDETASEWLAGLPIRYSKRAVYILKWDSKNLRDFSKIFQSAGLFQKTLIPSSYLVGMMGIASVAILAREPWLQARNNTVDAGRWLTDYIQQNGGEYVLMGHSLGARVVYYCLDSLRASYHYGAVQDAYLFGGAIDNKACEETQADINWHGFDETVSGKIHNYYSDEDSILKYLFNLAEGFTEDPIGRCRIEHDNVKNYDVTENIMGHTEYKGKLSIILA